MHRIHPATQPVAVARHAERGLVTERHVEAEFGIIPWGAAVDRVDLSLAKGAVHVELGLVADVAHRAAE